MNPATDQSDITFALQTYHRNMMVELNHYLNNEVIQFLNQEMLQSILDGVMTGEERKRKE